MDNAEYLDLADIFANSVDDDQRCAGNDEFSSPRSAATTAGIWKRTVSLSTAFGSRKPTAMAAIGSLEAI
jgi:hypothetical protein